MKLLSPTLGSHAWGPSNRRISPQTIWFWRSVWFDYRNSTRLGKTETPLLVGEGGGRDMQAVMYTWTQDKSQWPCKSPGQSYLQNWRVSCRGRGWLLTHYQDKNTDSDSSGEYSLAWTLLEVTISHQEKRPNISSAGTPQARQPTGQEDSHAHQQTSCLKSSGAHGCLLNRNPVVVLPDKGTRFSSTH